MALIYLATYPRSGNSLLQRILAVNFWRLASQIKATPRPFETMGEQKGWDRRPAPEPLEGWPAGLLWSRRTAVYRRSVEGEPWRRQLLDVAAEELTPELRTALAAEAEPFLVKTHHRPFPSYLDGERVIQVVRHPGPTLWSYFRLMVQQALERGERSLKSPPPTLERIIDGQTPFGGWTDYHRDWNDAAQGLGSRCLRLDFARMSEDQAATRTALADFLSLPIRSDVPVSFKTYTGKRASLGLRGRDEDYERFYTRGQLDRLWRTHGEEAGRLGFQPPELALAAQDDQVDRLSDLLDFAWTAAARKTE